MVGSIIAITQKKEIIFLLCTGNIVLANPLEVSGFESKALLCQQGALAI
jgi:hypothetical protein